MIKLKFQCTRRNEILNNNDVVVELSLTPSDETLNANPNNMYAMGAAVGTPNTNQPNVQATETNESKFRVTASGFTMTLSGTAEETGVFNIGKVYEFTLNEQAPKKETK